MYCPFCSYEDTKVLESRILDDSMRRRRECLKCTNRFTTYEKAAFSLMVIKKNGKVQPFDQNKIAASIERACGKVEPQEVERLTSHVHQKVLRKKTNQVKSIEIGRFVLQELRKSNKIAYVRFASVHKEIEDPKMLERELQTIV